MSDDPIVARWNLLRDRVEAAARRAMENPDEAAQHGLQPEILRQHGRPLSEPPFAGWLRAAARNLIPPAYDWELVNAIGGQSFLLLKSYRDDLSSTVAQADIRPGPSGFG